MTSISIVSAIASRIDYSNNGTDNQEGWRTESKALQSGLEKIKKLMVEADVVEGDVEKEILDLAYDIEDALASFELASQSQSQPSTTRARRSVTNMFSSRSGETPDLANLMTRLKDVCKKLNPEEERSSTVVQEPQPTTNFPDGQDRSSHSLVGRGWFSPRRSTSKPHPPAAQLAAKESTTATSKMDQEKGPWPAAVAFPNKRASPLLLTSVGISKDVIELEDQNSAATRDNQESLLAAARPPDGQTSGSFFGTLKNIGGNRKKTTRNQGSSKADDPTMGLQSEKRSEASYKAKNQKAASNSEAK